MAGDYEELKGVLIELLTNRFAPKPQYTRGLLGDGQGNVVVPGNPDRNFARFNRGSTEYFEIFNVTVPPVDGWPVLIGELPWLPGLTQVVGTDWAAYEQSGWGDSISSTSPHAPTHEWPDGGPGADPLNVYLRSIVPLRAYALGSGSTSIYVNTYEYENTNGSGTVWGGLPGVDLQPVISSLSTGTARMMGVYLDPALNSLGIVTGITDIFTDASFPPYPAFPAGVLPSARVRVYGGQSSIGEIDIRDARRPFGRIVRDFGTIGIQTDVIAESTAASGVTVDGVLLKDSDVFAQSSTNGLNARFERLFGDDVPANSYKFTQRTFVVNSGANQLGFEDSQASPYAPPGGSNFSINLVGNASASSNVFAHWLRLTSGTTGAGSYLQWANATPLNFYRFLMSMESISRAADTYLGELRFWDAATFASGPVANDGWVAIRFNYYGTTYPQWPLRMEHVYGATGAGTGVTFAISTGTTASSVPFFLGIPFYFDIQIGNDSAPGFLVASISQAESPFRYANFGASVANTPTQFNYARLRIGESNQFGFLVDNVVVS